MRFTIHVEGTKTYLFQDLVTDTQPVTYQASPPLAVLLTFMAFIYITCLVYVFYPSEVRKQILFILPFVSFRPT